MRIIIIVALLFSGCAARPYPRLNAQGGQRETIEQAKVRMVIALRMQPDSVPWQITLLESDAWRRKLDYYSRGHSRDAGGWGFTVREWHHTYLNAEWVRSATDEDIARVLAHEWGHIVCNPRCDDDEEAADDAGRHIMRIIR